MKPSDKLIKKFQKSYFEEYKKKITRQQARKILVILIEMIGRLKATFLESLLQTNKETGDHNLQRF